MKIRDFIETTLNEDELWALAASAPPSYQEDQTTVVGGVHWVWGMGGNWEHYTPDPLEEYLGENWDCGDGEEGGPTLVTREEFPVSWGGRPLAHSVLSGVEEVRTADAAHIVRWDPARVLGEIEAERAILAEHVADHCVGDVFTDDECPTLRALARCNRNHPNYDQRWDAP